MQNLLNLYNPHWKNGFKYDLIERPRYIKKCAPLLERKEILVVKGIRRTGKSGLLKLMINHLMAQKRVPPQNILFMNLEDYRLGTEKQLETLEEILTVYREMKQPQGRVYVFLDEIQEFQGFERWLRSHYEQDETIKFIISGSSSSMFSKELGTLLTGRNVEVEVFPFTFREILDCRSYSRLKNELEKSVDMLYLSKSATRIKEHLNLYLMKGGFPEMIKRDDVESNVPVLQQYFTDIILRDVVERNGLRSSELLKKLAMHLIFNMSNSIVITRYAERLNNNRTTILHLIDMLREAYLVFPTTCYLFSVQGRVVSTKARKIYCVDNGLFTALKTNDKGDAIKRMRNAIFKQLHFDWEEKVYFWRNGLEIDFVVSDGFPISVATSQKETDKRITKTLYYMQSHNLERGIVINQDKLHLIEEGNQTVLLLPFWMFMAKSKEDIMAAFES